MNLVKNLNLEDKLRILSDAAKYDVACTSSGIDRTGKKGNLGNSRACGICHSFASDGRCISLLKVLLSNECIYDCKYCLNRRTNQKTRTTFTPEELSMITIEFYKRNYIEGLFLSSGIIKNPTYTMELMYRTLSLLRNQYHFRGYIHAKAVPGADPEIISRMGYLADRMSKICFYGTSFWKSIPGWKYIFFCFKADLSGNEKFRQKKSPGNFRNSFPKIHWPQEPRHSPLRPCRPKYSNDHRGYPGKRLSAFKSDTGHVSAI